MIRESIDSLLAQTFKNFDVIIILDEPSRTDVDGIVESYENPRLKIYHNERNLGLALSMNYAASLTDAPYLARMDADDVATTDRLEKEFALVSCGKYDFVFSQYYYIDDTSKIIERKLQPLIDDGISHETISLYPSVIHHPTVMFTRSIFEKAGGYRAFPCSQDADLWLRMCEAGCRFHMIGEPLLYYRINPDSVSSKKWFRQQLTCYYIFNLSLQRIKFGRDNFSLIDYEQYLEKWGNGDKIAESKLRASFELLSRSKNNSSGLKKIGSFATRLWVFCSSPILRKHYLDVIMKKYRLPKC